MRSLKYKYWKSVIDLRRCMECKKHQGKIYLLYDIIPEEPPLHPNCRCSVQLPGYYITEDEATKLGWIPILANLASVAPGKMLTKGVYKN